MVRKTGRFEKSGFHCIPTEISKLILRKSEIPILVTSVFGTNECFDVIVIISKLRKLLLESLFQGCYRN